MNENCLLTLDCKTSSLPDSLPSLCLYALSFNSFQIPKNELSLTSINRMAGTETKRSSGNRKFTWRNPTSKLTVEMRFYGRKGFQQGYFSLKKNRMSRNMAIKSVGLSVCMERLVPAPLVDTKMPRCSSPKTGPLVSISADSTNHGYWTVLPLAVSWIHGCEPADTECHCIFIGNKKKSLVSESVQFKPTWFKGQQ